MKKPGVMLIVLCIIIAIMSTGNTAEAVEVALMGRPIEFPDAQPFVDANGRTLVPIRYIGDALGCEVEWNGDLQRARFIKQTSIPGKSGQITIDFFINENNYTVVRGNSGNAATPVEELEMDTAAVLKDSRTFAPVRYLAEALGAVVGWEAETRTVTITYETISAAGFDIPVTASFGYSITSGELENEVVKGLVLTTTIFAQDHDTVAAEIGMLLNQEFGQNVVDQGIAKIKEYLNADRSAVLSAAFFDSSINRYFVVAKHGINVIVEIYEPGKNPADYVFTGELE